MVLKEVIVTLIAFSGLLFGYLLARIAREEVKPASKYLLFIKRAIAVIAGLSFLYLSYGNTTITLTFAIGMVISLLVKKEFFYIGLLVALSIFMTNAALLLFSSLAFIHACIYGILTIRKNAKNILVNLSMFLLPFLLILVEYLIGKYNQLFFIASMLALSKFVVMRRGLKAKR